MSRDELSQRRTLKSELGALLADARPIAREGAQLAAQEAALQARLGALGEIEDRVRQRLENADTPGEERRLERRLAAVVARELTVEGDLYLVVSLREANQRRATAIEARADKLRAQAEALGGEAAALAAEAAATVAEAASLEQSKSALQQEATEASTQAADLQEQKGQLEVLQQKAKSQQKKAEDLKDQLTKELTKAGGDKQATDQRLVKLQNALAKTTGIEVLSPPILNDDRDAAIFNAIPTTRPAATATADLVRTVREYVIPQSTAEGGITAHVGGQTASYVDLASGISDRLLLVIAAVVMLGFIVLTMAFRSVLVSTQAAVANVLSVTAAFGVVTLLFQEGLGISLVGLDTASGTDPVASFVPLIMFAVLFGLSMDYQVFLMSQIEQHRAKTDDDREAIAAGLASGGRVIAAAALIMISVFASFILNGDPTVKQFGVGLSVGVALAAMTVLLLAPALLTLAGRGGWWVPTWAERVLPHVDIEGAHLKQEAAEQETA